MSSRAQRGVGASPWGRVRQRAGRATAALWLAAAFLACGGEPAPSPSVVPPAVVPAAIKGEDYANPQGCVEGFEPGQDYFPAKARLRHAEQVTIEYGDHYKILTLRKPWADAEQAERYLLLLCGTPRPEGYGDHVTIEIPARSLVTTSTTELPHLVELGVVDRLVGHDAFDWVYSKAVREHLATGTVAEIGSAPNLDLERLVALAPELVLADSLGDPQQGLLARLRRLGLPVVLAPSFLETSPLGRAEWLLVTSLFFNREDRAEDFFAGVERRYRFLVKAVQEAETGVPPSASVLAKPTVLTGGPIEDTWWVPGGGSFVARLLTDAGGDYPWAHEGSTGSLPLSLESVLERAAEADFWLHPGRFGSRAEILAVDPRLEHFRALAEGRVWGNDARVNAGGGNDYWESGSLRPDLVLADLVEILYPDVLDLQLTYHRRLPAEPVPRPRL